MGKNVLPWNVKALSSPSVLAQPGKMKGKWAKRDSSASPLVLGPWTNFFRANFLPPELPHPLYLRRKKMSGQVWQPAVCSHPPPYEPRRRHFGLSMALKPDGNYEWPWFSKTPCIGLCSKFHLRPTFYGDDLRWLNPPRINSNTNGSKHFQFFMVREGGRCMKFRVCIETTT